MNTIEKAIKFYGEKSQEDKAIEEMSELTKAIIKRRYAKEDYAIEICDTAIAEEMADTIIMLEQLLMIYGNEKEVETWKQKKLERLEKRMESEVEKNDKKGSD